MVQASEIDGVLPTKQQRARATRDRLIAAGFDLVETRDFDALSVAEIAATAGCSVGAFYVRFTDKDAFFRALVAERLTRARTALPAALRQSADPVASMVAMAVENFRRRPGLLRSALRRSMEDPTVWSPLREHGHYMADELVSALTEQRGRRLAKAAEHRLRFAFQMMMGTLVNALVNQPGPLQLDDPRLEGELLRAFRLVMAE
jgi:AcrR family transcriptional regulator